jgi:hypothetical protein
VVDANALTVVQKRAGAQQVGLSETAVVSASDVATVKLEFPTSTRQIPHYGHATIATFSLLRYMGVVGEGRLSKETVDGTRAILVDGGMAFMEQRAPEYTQVPPTSELGDRVVASLGLMRPQLVSGVDPSVVKTGNAFLIVPLGDECSLAALRPHYPEGPRTLLSGIRHPGAEGANGFTRLQPGGGGGYRAHGAITSAGARLVTRPECAWRESRRLASRNGRSRAEPGQSGFPPARIFRWPADYRPF